MDFSREEYKIKYDELIEGRRGDRLERGELYTENHHIVPRSFFGSDIPDSIIDHEDNLVLLSGKEHYIAHYYLYHSLEKRSREYQKAMWAMHILNGSLEGREKDMGFTIEELGDMYQKAKEDYREHLKATTIEKIKEIDEWIKTNNTHPKQSKKASEYEYGLGKRLSRLKEKKKNDYNWFPEFDTLIESLKIEKYFKLPNPEQDNLVKLKRLLDWIDTNKRLPTRNKNSNESKLASTLSEFRQNKRKGIRWYESFDTYVIERGHRDIFKIRDTKENDTLVLKTFCGLLSEHGAPLYEGYEEVKNIQDSVLWIIKKRETHLWLDEYTDIIKEYNCDEFINKQTQLFTRNKPIIQYSLDGEFINKFPSTTLALKHINRKSNTSILASCHHTSKQAYGYKWRFLGDTRNLDEVIKVKNRNTIVEQYTFDGELVAEYKSVKDALEKTGITNISSCCTGVAKSAGSYLWKYKNSDKVIERPKIVYRTDELINQYNLDGELLQCFDNANHASKVTGIKKEYITACCSTTNRKKSTNDFVFKYKVDVEKGA